MKIVVAVRCLNEERNIPRFLHGYDFADFIVVSDGGSTDKSVQLLEQNKKVLLYHFDHHVEVDGEYWNEDAPHMNFVLGKARELEPDWLIFDDLDDVPNYLLRENARYVLENADIPQVNAFRLYMWGDKEYFPHMNRNFHLDYTSLWAWMPNKIHISADVNVKHGTLIGLSKEPYKILPPMCLLHKSWYPNTIDAKVERYNKLGLNTSSPLNFAGKPAPLPEWAIE